MKNRPGIAAISTTFVVSLVLIMVAAAIVFIITSETRETSFRIKEKQAFYLAEAGLEQAIVNVQSSLESVYKDAKNVNSPLAWLSSIANTPNYVIGSLETGSFSVDIVSVESDYMQKDIIFYAQGSSKGVTEQVHYRATFGFDPSLVFDYSYFINNYGWFYGGSQYFAGDVRANGAFKVMGAQRIDGDVYANGSIDESQGNFFYSTMAEYYANASTRARPGDPPAPGEDFLEGGYDAFADLYDASNNPRDPGRPQLHANQEKVDMPYLGDLSIYQTLAQSQDGTISQGGTVIVDNVYTGNLVLVGTTANPIVINGPVVVTNDVIIKGVVQGKGTIYAGRNVHIINNLTYSDPPAWPKPDTDPDGTMAANANKDILALCAKGNVMFGDYNHSSWNTVKKYLKPPFTSAYEVDPTDAGIGYVSYTQDGDPYFNGDYTANDGGTKTDGSARKYYESSLSDAQWTALGPSNSITQIDALIYDNHAVSGRISNCAINGSLIARDEAIVFSGSINVNYDYRVKKNALEYINIQLPISVMEPERKAWSQ